VCEDILFDNSPQEKQFGLKLWGLFFFLSYDFVFQKVDSKA
jgi:hypothetical protein